MHRSTNTGACVRVHVHTHTHILAPRRTQMHSPCFMSPVVCRIYFKASSPGHALSYQREQRQMDMFHFSPFISSIFPQAGTQISLADLPFSNEIFMLWYNLLPSKQMPCEKNEEEKGAPVVHSEEPGLGPIDLVSHPGRQRSTAERQNYSVGARCGGQRACCHS